MIDVLGDDGLFANKLSNFKSREVQIQLAEKIVETIENNHTLIAEAGTGTGKTFAYLVPAILKGKKTIVSTGTKNLQEQLFYRDLPKVLEIMDMKPKIRLLKGRSNYLCHHRLYNTSRSKLAKSPEFALPLKLIDRWSHNTILGDMAELESVPENAPVWRLVTSTAENCLGSECPNFTDCLVMKARRRAMDADILVVNHHLLFADMAIKQEGFGELLPDAEVVILDEAHQVPETASRFFSKSFSSRQCQDLINDATKEAGEIPGSYAVISDQIQWVEQSLRDLYLQFSNMPASDTLENLLVNAVNHEFLELLQQSLKDLSESLKPIASQSKGLDSCFIRAEMLVAFIEELLNGNAKTFVYWYEIRNKFFIFHKTPIDISDPLSQFREQNKAAWILTSATLAVNKSFCPLSI